MSFRRDPSARRTPPDRRVVLIGTAGAAVLAVAAPGMAWVRTGGRAAPIIDPFRPGVAPGDPLSDGTVPSTRLAPTPVTGGLGSTPARDTEVEWEHAPGDALNPA